MKIEYSFFNDIKSSKFKLYSFATENIGGYIDCFDFVSKKVLTVASSGDHVINAIFKGAKSVVAFDIHKEALFYTELKLLALQNFDLNTFLEFFMIDSKLALDYKLFSEIKNKMSSDAREFWKQEYKKNNNDGFKLRNSEIFNNTYDTIEKKLFYNPYLNPKNYLIAQKNVEDCSVVLMHIELIQLPRILTWNNKFDTILLSNISDYIENFISDKNCLEKFLKDCILPLKTKSNEIQIAYIYDINSAKSRSDIDDKVKREKELNKIKLYSWQEISFISAIDKEKQDSIIKLL
ncbi:MAG: DUF3419 family protein [Clostridia bacterium]